MSGVVSHHLALDRGQNVGIDRVRFTVCTSRDIRRNSVCEVKVPQLGTDGPDDGRLGSIDPCTCCQTCEQAAPMCKGHFGHIELGTHVVMPYMVKPLEHVLRSVCFMCALKKTKSKACEACGCPYPTSVVVPDPCSLTVTWPANSEWPEDMPREQVQEVFEKRWDFDHVYDLLHCIGEEHQWDFKGHPRDLLLDAFPVPSNNLRPSVFCKGKQCTHNRTLVIQDIVKQVHLLRDAEGERDRAAAKYNLYTHIHRYLTSDPNASTSVQKRGKHWQASLNSRVPRFSKTPGVLHDLKGKKGQLRRHSLGKRVNHCARSVITGDTTIRMDQLLIPRSVGATLTYPERVTERSLAALQTCVDTGPGNPGGAHSITVPGEGITHLSNDPGHVKPRIKTGYIVHRHLREGDVALLNRAPTLHRASMMAFRLKFHDKKVFSFHPSVTTPFNADFDGDEMNTHIPQSEMARAEAITLQSVASNILGAGTSSPLMGCIQDAVLGLSLLSRQTDPLPVAALQALGVQGAGLTGPQAISTALPPGLWYDRKGVVIRDGTLVRGTLNKSVLGPSDGGIVHVACLDLGEETAMRMMEALTTVGCAYTECYGASTGPGDCTLTAHEREVRDRIINVCRQTTNVAVLDHAHRALEKIDPERTATGETGLQNMIAAASKGNPMNQHQMRMGVGQQYVRGVPPTCPGSDRVLPLFAHGDGRMQARGFVGHSFVDGMTPAEVVFHGMGGREGVVDTAVKTADTGYAYRRLVRSLEDVHANWAGDALLNSGLKLCPLGGHGCGPERMVHVTLDSLRLPDADLSDTLCPSLARKCKREIQATILRPWCTSRAISYRCALPCDVERIYRKHLAMQECEGESDAAFPEDADVMNLALRVKSPFYTYAVAALPRRRLRSWDAFQAEVVRHIGRARMEDHTPIGILAASSVAAPMTQLNLNTFHHAGQHRKSESGGLPRVNELINASHNEAMPITTLRLLHPIPLSASVQALRGVPLTSMATLDEDRLVATLLPDAGTTAEDAARCLRSQGIECEALEGGRVRLAEPLPARSTATGRGVACITDAFTEEEEFPRASPCGGIEMVSEVVIRVVGYGCLQWAQTQPWWVDCGACYSNSVPEVEETFGIFAAQVTLYEQLRRAMSGLAPLNSMHALLLACFMCCSGKYRGLNRFGCFSDPLSTGASVLTQSAFERANEVITSAARVRATESIRNGSVTAQLLFNTEVSMGTGSVRLRIAPKDAHGMDNSRDGEANPLDDMPILSMCATHRHALQDQRSVSFRATKRRCVSATYQPPPTPAAPPPRHPHIASVSALFSMMTRGEARSDPPAP